MQRTLTADSHSFSHHEETHRSLGLTGVGAVLGRTLFATIFLIAGPGHFNDSAVQYAASQGVPMPEILVPVSGVLAMAGGICVLLGLWARLGAWLLVLFLVPVTLAMHDFWNVADPAEAGLQQAMFLKNLSMLGGALLIAHFGGGPLSLTHARRGRRSF